MHRYKSWTQFVVLLTCVTMLILTFTDASIGKEHAEYEKHITVALKTLKDIYEPGEAVPLL